MKNKYVTRLSLLLLPIFIWGLGKIHYSNERDKAFEIFRTKGDELLTLDYSISTLSDCYHYNGFKNLSNINDDEDSSCEAFSIRLDKSLKNLSKIMVTSPEMDKEINTIMNRKNKVALNNHESKIARDLYNIYLDQFKPEAKAYGYKDVREAMVY